MNQDNDLPGHDKFYHPFKPYDIQLSLMKCIYDTLSYNNNLHGTGASNGKKICIIESPTGTGKTLSLICSTVTWLRDHKKNILEHPNINTTTTTTNIHTKDNNNNNNNIHSDEDSEPDWVNEIFNNNLINEKVDQIVQFETYLDNLNINDNRNIKICNIDNKSFIKKRKLNQKHVPIVIEDNEFLPDPYDNTNTNQENVLKKNNRLNKFFLSNEIEILLNKIDNNKDILPNDTNNSNPTLNNPIKIIFASRTHSQLSQFANQLTLPHFPSSFKTSLKEERIKFLPLASKKQLCINPDVKKWGALEAINDACYELRHKKKKSDSKQKNTGYTVSGCPFYQFDKDTVSPFTDQIYHSIHDIEDLVTIGEHLKMCPYYASRYALQGVEIVTLPYQYLLSDTARNSMELNLKDNIVVIDEAHNLIETINNIYSSEVSLNDLIYCQIGLSKYLQKFKLRLNPGNRINLLKLLKLLNVIIKYINDNFVKPGIPINDFIDYFNENNTDTLNVYHLIKYINDSKVAYKISTYMESLKKEKQANNPAINIENNNNNNTDNKGNESTSSKPILFKFVQFLTSLTHPSKEGQFFFDKGPSIKYILLEPSKLFQPIIEDAKCVILAGGTMEPMDEFKDYLFPYLTNDQIVKYSCNHIIPDQNLETFIVNQQGLEFTYLNRKNLSLINDFLFQFFMNLSDNVPNTGGIVAFFPSYQFLANVIQTWQKNGLFEKIDNKRTLLYESKNGSDPLDNYSEIINNNNSNNKNNKGAILFAVVGGKLSEGINFQDNLCRAIVMVGLPYPNLQSGELQIKRRHLEEKVTDMNNKNPNLKPRDPKIVVKDFLDNLCMKAVNQSVGRSIRHINDYSVIILLDSRYDRENIKNRLSHWVRNRIQPERSVQSIMHNVKEFFDDKKMNKEK